ncbi:hypothetical protein [Azospirillum sp. TSO35-2]|uniref:hypothetical protein n=1 Tax=Azospirillum sp. TSO35-2 TaxID=716796 RepID=UPI0013050489|nr:hypothetical protein [Azospirillum sp. TSO35-2]
MNPVVMIPDAYGHKTNILTPPSHRQVHSLTPATAVTISIPAGAQTVLMAATTDYWVQYEGDAVLPTASVTGGKAPEFNPMARSVAGLAALSFVSEKAGFLSLGFYG